MTYSNAGQDEWILSQFPDDYVGYAVELGALDGDYLSNTQRLEERGWTVLCIEPNPKHQEALRARRKLVYTCACDVNPADSVELHDHGAYRDTYTSIRSGAPVVGEVPVITLNMALHMAGFPRLDVLSLDVDGIELDILEGLYIGRWRPKVCVIETRGQGGPIHNFMEGEGYDNVGYRDEDTLFLRRHE